MAQRESSSTGLPLLVAVYARQCQRRIGSSSRISCTCFSHATTFAATAVVQEPKVRIIFYWQCFKLYFHITPEVVVLLIFLYACRNSVFFSDLGTYFRFFLHSGNFAHHLINYSHTDETFLEIAKGSCRYTNM